MDPRYNYPCICGCHGTFARFKQTSTCQKPRLEVNNLSVMSKPKALSMLKKLGMGQLLGPKSKRPSLWFITFIYNVGFCEEMSKRKEQFSPNLFVSTIVVEASPLGLGLCTWGMGFLHWTWAFDMGVGLSRVWAWGFHIQHRHLKGSVPVCLHFTKFQWLEVIYAWTIKPKVHWPIDKPVKNHM